MTVDRHIPESWFRASPLATTMAFIMPREHKLRMAPISADERLLGWFVLPPFQRPPVWTMEQKVRFIESAWMGLPIGAFVYNQTPDMKSRFDCWLLDGQQRITAIIEYINDEFDVFGHKFSELTEADHRRWDMSVSFPALRTTLQDEEKLRDVYDRLAYGGTPHEPKAS